MSHAHIAVIPVLTRDDLTRFLDLPSELYRGDQNWVPPIRASIARLLAQGPSFERYGPFQPFLATRGDRLVGRIVAAINYRLAGSEGQNIGIFGFFECTDDQEVASTLLATACQWLRERGCTLVRGPIDLSTHINCLLQVDGFDGPPYIMMPYNPAYYPRLVETAGWKRIKDAYAYHLVVSEARARIFERAYRRATAAGVEFRPICTYGRGFESDCRALYRVYTHAFAANWSATTRSEEEFVRGARELRYVVDRRIFPVAVHDGRMVGFWMALPNYNIALRHVGGRLNVGGLLKMLWHWRRIDSGRVVAIGVLPEYQRSPVAPALVYCGLRGALDRRRPYRQAELSWVWSDNGASRKLIEASGGRHYRTYRMYEYSLTS